MSAPLFAAAAVFVVAALAGVVAAAASAALADFAVAVVAAAVVSAALAAVAVVVSAFAEAPASIFGLVVGRWQKGLSVSAFVSLPCSILPPWPPGWFEFSLELGLVLQLQGLLPPVLVRALSQWM